jgi:hypothetical protein
MITEVLDVMRDRGRRDDDDRGFARNGLRPQVADRIVLGRRVGIGESDPATFFSSPREERTKKFSKLLSHKALVNDVISQPKTER